MSNARSIEQQIARSLLRRRERPQASSPTTLVADRLITIAAVTVGILFLGTYLQELLWVVLGAAAVLTLGTRNS